jgi:hypothetical protein
MAYKGVSVHDLITDPEVHKINPIFNPLREEFIYTDLNSNGVKTSFLNFYQAPPWKSLKVEPKYTGFIKKLFEHLFPVEEDREYVLDWFHHALVGRNATVLCLVGARGTGKTILLDDIAKPLVGSNMYARGNQSILEDKFNPQFENRRFIFLDEADLEEEKAIMTIKNYTNDSITIEKKGCDPYTTQNYVSLALATNIRDRFKVGPQERRFSVPRVAEDNLNTVIPPEEISEFVEKVKNPLCKEIAEFGHWLLNRQPKYDSQRPYLNRYFFELCELTMPDWKVFLRDFLGRAEEMDQQFEAKTIQDAFAKRDGNKLAAHFGQSGAKFPTRRKTVEEFLYQYRYRGKYKIGETYDYMDNNSRPRWGVEVNPDFWEAYRAEMYASLDAKDVL